MHAFLEMHLIFEYQQYKSVFIVNVNVARHINFINFPRAHTFKTYSIF